jgi:peptidoglycan/xylan/chitin deacetylase (PgdA/CDA1 family)
MHNGKWQPSSLIKASAVVHAGAAAALAWPPTMLFGVAGLLANHAVLAAAGLWPRSTLLGPNILHLSGERAEVALTIDDGPDPEVTPQVLDILAAHGVRATFFCVAAQVRNHPALAKRIVAEGHHIENHSMLHRHHFSLLGLGGIRKELALAQQVITEATGRKPQFFRAPAGLRNPFLDPVLHQLDLQLVSWTRRGFDTRVGDVQKVARRLLHDARAGDILLLHDGNAARSKDASPVIVEVLPQLIGALTQRGLRFVRLADGMRA